MRYLRKVKGNILRKENEANWAGIMGIRKHEIGGEFE
jgi:hypothetical protein